jgi:LuxR family maltose regulon positive regulatory protein
VSSAWSSSDPPQLRLVLASRMDPPFRLGRLRVRQQLVEVRDSDLRFAAHEAPALLGEGRARAGRATYRRCTCGPRDGRPARAGGLSLQRTGDTQQFVADFAGDDSLVVEYLRDEFLAGLDPEDRSG